MPRKKGIRISRVGEQGQGVGHGEYAPGSTYCKCGKRLSGREHLLRHIRLMANKVKAASESESTQTPAPELAGKDDIMGELISRVTASLFLMYSLDNVKTIGFIESTRLLIHQKFVVETNHAAMELKDVLDEIKKGAGDAIREALHGL